MIPRALFPYAAAAFAASLVLWGVAPLAAFLAGRPDLVEAVAFLGIGAPLSLLCVVAGCYLFGYCTATREDGVPASPAFLGAALPYVAAAFAASLALWATALAAAAIAGRRDLAEAVLLLGMGAPLSLACVLAGCYLLPDAPSRAA